MAKVEIFTADCYLCDGVVQQVNDLVCSKCEVIVYDLNKKVVPPNLRIKPKLTAFNLFRLLRLMEN